MPSYLASGLAEGISPFVQELFKSKLRQREEERKPSAQLQRGLLDAVSTILSASRTAPQEEAGLDLERRAALGEFGTQPDLQNLIATQTPTGQRVGQAEQFMNTLKTLGIAGLGADGITFKQPTDVTSLLALTGMGGFIPERVRQGPVTYVNPRAIEERASAAVKGKGLNVQESSQLENFQTALDSIDKISRNLKGPQGGINNLLQASFPFSPGQRGLAFDIKNVSDTLLRMRSGAQINEREYQRLRSLLPVGTDVLFGEPGVVQKKLDTFKQNFQAVLERQRRRGFSPIGQEQVIGTTPSESGDELSSMSDEELRAIAGM